MKFRYKKYGPGVFRPVIPIDISYLGRTLTYEVLVDSGADMCIFDAQIGEILGIDIKKGQKSFVGGITGKDETYYIHEVKIAVGGWPFEIPVGFLPQMADLSYGVVGQKGFFDNFVVKFDLLKQEIELKPRT